MNEKVLNIKTLKEVVGTMIHHDTITGTSPGNVIANESATIQAAINKNSEILGQSLKQKILDEESIKIDDLR